MFLKLYAHICIYIYIYTYEKLCQVFPLNRSRSINYLSNLKIKLIKDHRCPDVCCIATCVLSILLDASKLCRLINQTKHIGLVFETLFSRNFELEKFFNKMSNSDSLSLVVFTNGGGEKEKKKVICKMHS